MKILIVEDEPDIRETTQMLLELDGHEVTSVGDWRDTTDMATPFDVVLQDVRMPGLDLPSHLATLRRSGAQRIVLVTADRIDGAAAAALGVDGLVRKPFAYAELEATLHG